MKPDYEAAVLKACQVGLRIDPDFLANVYNRLAEKDLKAAKEFARVVQLDVRKAA